MLRWRGQGSELPEVCEVFKALAAAGFIKVHFADAFAVTHGFDFFAEGFPQADAIAHGGYVYLG